MHHIAHANGAPIFVGACWVAFSHGDEFEAHLCGVLKADSLVRIRCSRAAAAAGLLGLLLDGLRKRAWGA